MDPKIKMPDIKAEVNKVDGGKKKAAGLFSGLLGGGGSGAAGGLGGLGAGAAAGGGLLATKAGMLALVLMGSAVAGGIGLAGYKMFGPGEADRTGGNLSLFTPKPQQTADSSGAAPAGGDGASASLNYMSQAAAKDRAAEAADAAAAGSAASADGAESDPARDAAAADAARRAAEAKAAAAGAINAGGGAGAVGSMGKGGLANAKKLGALSSSSGGGATAPSAGSSGSLGANLANASRNGVTSAFSKGAASKATAGSNRGVASARGKSARGDARRVMGDQARGAAHSSFAAGKTYDGTTAGAGGEIGPDGGAIGMGGGGAGEGAQPKALAANAKGSDEREPPVAEPPATNVTPWETQMMIGMGLGLAAIGLLYFASTMMKEAKAEAMAAMVAAEAAMATIPVGAVALAAAGEAYMAAVAKLQMAKWIIGAALLASLGGVAMGTMIATGKNGQTLQGGLLIASSAMIGTIATLLLISANNSLTPTDASEVQADSNLAAFDAPPTWMYVIGGVAAVGLVGTMLAPKKTCKSDEEGCHAYYQQHRGSGTYAA